MSTQEPYINPNETHIQPPKKGMSSGMKALLIVAIIFGLLILLCCGGIVGVVIHMAGAVSEDPTVIAEHTARFAEIEIPSQFAPRLSLDMTVPFLGKEVVSGVVYADESSESMLIMGSLGAMTAQQNPDDVRRQLEQSMREQGGIDPGEDVDEWESSLKEIEVRGEPVPFNFAVGKNPDTGAGRIEVSGMFEGKSGPVMLILSTDTEVIDEQAIVEMIKSIK